MERVAWIDGRIAAAPQCEHDDRNGMNTTTFLHIVHSFPRVRPRGIGQRGRSRVHEQPFPAPRMLVVHDDRPITVDCVPITSAVRTYVDGPSPKTSGPYATNRYFRGYTHRMTRVAPRCTSPTFDLRSEAPCGDGSRCVSGATWFAEIRRQTKPREGSIVSSSSRADALSGHCAGVVRMCTVPSPNAYVTAQPSIMRVFR